MQTNYENALSFIESLGWNDEKLRKADGIIPLVATMLELYSRGQELKPIDIKMDNLIEKAKKILSEADSGSIVCSHYNNGFLDGIKFTESELKNRIKPAIIIDIRKKYTKETGRLYYKESPLEFEWDDDYIDWLEQNLVKLCGNIEKK